MEQPTDKESYCEESFVDRHEFGVAVDDNGLQDAKQTHQWFALGHDPGRGAGCDG